MDSRFNQSKNIRHLRCKKCKTCYVSLVKQNYRYFYFHYNDYLFEFTSEGEFFMSDEFSSGTPLIYWKYIPDITPFNIKEKISTLLLLI